MNISSEQQDQLSKEMLKSFVGLNSKSIDEILSQGADPLHPVNLTPDMPKLSMLKVVFNKTFNQPFDCDLFVLQGFAKIAIKLLLATKGQIPAELIEMAAVKPEIPDAYYADKQAFPKDDKVKYECNYLGSPLPEVRAILTYHELRALVAGKGKIAFPKEQPTHDHFEYSWENDSAENAEARQVLELLRKTWPSTQALYKVLTDNELWRSPEDAAAFAALTSKEHELCHRTELLLPAEMFRSLNEHDARTHLSRYFQQKNANSQISVGAP